MTRTPVEAVGDLVAHLLLVLEQKGVLTVEESDQLLDDWESERDWRDRA